MTHPLVQHTIIVTDIPILLLNAKNQARRLITLLDSLCAFQSILHDLYPALY